MFGLIDANDLTLTFVTMAKTLIMSLDEVTIEAF